MARGKREEKRMQRNRMILSGFIVLLMLMSGFAIFTSQASNQNVISDYGIRFKITENLAAYQAKIDGETREFYFIPTDANIPMNDAVPEVLNNAVYAVVSFDPSTDRTNLQAIDFIRYDLNQFYNKDFFPATTIPSSQFNYPVLTCANATATTPVIQIALSQESEILYENNCITLKGNVSGLLKTRDRIIYSALGVYG